jgi:hypothetical protein
MSWNLNVEFQTGERGTVRAVSKRFDTTGRLLILDEEGRAWTPDLPHRPLVCVLLTNHTLGADEDSA